MSQFLLLALSFFVGWAVMVLELTASRLVIPLLGGSLYTWATVIGVVLAGLSVGAYIGGRVIDRFPSQAVLRSLLFLSGGAVLFMMGVSAKVPALVLLPISPIALIILVCTTLFLLPALLLGAVQPMVVKLASQNIERLGESYGMLSALWSLGSIVGVFSSAFYFIPTFGTWKTFLLVVLILFLSGFALWRKGTIRIVSIFAFFAVLVSLWGYTPKLGHTVLYAKDTPYFRAVVAEAYVAPLGSSRILFLDAGTHSIRRGTTTIPVYTDVTNLFAQHLSTTSRTLVIGGGAYTMPNDIAKTPAHVDVFEIDAEIPPIVKEYFSIDSKIVTHIGDARQLLRKSSTTYDIIFGDSFNSFLAVPWHLLTKEFNQEVLAHLTDTGLYAINVIAPLEGEGSDLYASVDKTLRSVFPDVDAYAFGGGPKEIQNIVFFASRTSLDDWRALAQTTQVLPGRRGTFDERRVTSVPTHGQLFTDDHTSTETMLLPLARRALPESLRLYYGMTN